MRWQHDGSVSPDPDMCIWGGGSFDGKHVFCKLANAWTNCLETGCFVRPDGGLCADDNSPEAMARRVRKIKRLEKEKNDGRR